MAYSELVKNFNRIRDYMREFYVYGFKSRDEYDRKSARSYDDERNALERVLLHFAHFEKQAERIDETHYRVTVAYDSDDETELVIRVLSFGPMLKVTDPPRFVGLIKERLIEQKSCGL